MTYIPSTEVLKCNCCSLVRLSRTCPHSLFSGSKLARSGANLMMVLCCFPGEHLKQSVYSLDKYSKKFLPVKSLKHFKSSFVYEHSAHRSDGKFMWFGCKGRERCHQFGPWKVYSASLFRLHVQTGSLSPCLEHSYL